MTVDIASGAETPRPTGREQAAAAIFLMQGLAPFIFAHAQSALLVVLTLNAIACVLLAWMLWHGKRWALRAALIFIALQVLAFNSPWLAWESYSGLRFGFYIEPRLNLLLAPFATFWSVGAEVYYSLMEPSAAVSAEFHAADGTRTFVVVNFAAVLVLLPLLAVKRQRDRQRRMPPPLPAVA